MTLRVGIAGWDYPDWNGIVYPARTPRGFDRLAHVARYVDVVEINSSFYRPVAPRVAESWARRTESFTDFRFSAKSHRSWTHERGADPDEVVGPTLAGLYPLLEAGRLGALLIQFPQSFHFDPQATARVEALVERIAGWPAVLEVRHVSWETEAAAEWCRGLGVGWCTVDQPRAGGSTSAALPWVTSDVGYFRLHGRNEADWFRPDAGRDARYDYLYSSEQLERLAGPIRRMAGETREMFVVQNNHFRGQALVNALQMKRLLQSVHPPAPEELVATYPDLARDVTVRRTKLF